MDKKINFNGYAQVIRGMVDRPTYCKEVGNDGVEIILSGERKQSQSSTDDMDQEETQHDRH